MKNLDIFSAQTYAVLLVIGGVIWLGWFLSRDMNDNSLPTPTQARQVEEAEEEQPKINSDPPPEFATVTDVIDSLTIVLDNKYIVRYLGVTTPRTTNEVQCFGKEALQANESLLEKTVRLEEDPVLAQARDGAWVRYVWVAEDEKSQEAYGKALSGAPVAGLTDLIPEEGEGSADQESNGVNTKVDESGEMNNEVGIGNDTTSIDENKVIADNEGQEEPELLPPELSGATEAEEENSEEDKIKEYLVSERIIEMGLGFPLLSQEMIHHGKLSAAARFSSATKRGLWKHCEISEDEETGLLKTQTIEECAIKGFLLPDKSKIYRTADCEGYKDTVVLKYREGEWLCSEEEAAEKGYEKAVDCS